MLMVWLLVKDFPLFWYPLSILGPCKHWAQYILVQLLQSAKKKLKINQSSFSFEIGDLHALKAEIFNTKNRTFQVI